MRNQIDGTQGAGPGLSKHSPEAQTLLYRKQRGVHVTAAAGVPRGWRGSGGTFICSPGCTGTQMLLWGTLSSPGLETTQASAQILNGHYFSNHSHVYRALWDCSHHSPEAGAGQRAPKYRGPYLRERLELRDARGSAGLGPRSSGSSTRGTGPAPPKSTVGTLRGCLCLSTIRS